MFDFITYPFSLLLLALYSFAKNYGVAIILFSLIVKVVLLPFSMKSKKSTLQGARLSPQLKDLEKRYGDNKAKYNEEVGKLYKENGVKPLSGCIWSIIPLPIMFALYSVLRSPFTKLMDMTQTQWEYLRDTVFPNVNLTITSGANGAYEQIQYAQKVHESFGQVSDYLTTNAQSITDAIGSVPVLRDIDFSFMGMNLAEIPQWNMLFKLNEIENFWPAFGLFLIPIISALLSYVSTVLTQKMSGSDPQAAQNMKTMTLMMPIMSLWIGFVMPAGMGLYWIANSVFSVIQEIILTKHYKKILDAEDAVRTEARRAREAEIERKREETAKLKAENATTRNRNTSRRKLERSEKVQDEIKTVEWERQNAPAEPKTAPEDAARVGGRKHARGRAYNPDRYETGIIAADTEPSASYEGVPEDKQ